MDRAGTVIEARDASTGCMRKADLCVFNLTRPAFTAELADDFHDLRSSRGADRVALGQQAARRVHHDATTQARGAAFDELSCLAAAAESKGFVIEQFGNTEGIVDLGNVDIFRPDAGLLVSLVRTPHCDFRYRHVTKTGRVLARGHVRRDDPYRIVTKSPGSGVPRTG